MSKLSQQFKVVIEFDSSLQDYFNVQIENLSPRKGYVDLERLKTQLLSAMHFMIESGIDSLVEHVEKETLH